MSYDHRSVQQMSAQPQALRRAQDDRDGQSTTDVSLTLRDQPGAYAYEDAAQAERIAQQRQLEAIQAPACQYQAQGSFRQAACGTTIQVSEHPSASASSSWVTLAVQSRARNNISADLGTGLQRLLGQVPQQFATEAKASGDTRAAKPSLFSGSADTCNPSGLSLLLLRASPIAKDAKLAPLGAEAVKSADALVEGLVPARKPTESRMVLRLLRAGFSFMCTSPARHRASKTGWSTVSPKAPTSSPKATRSSARCRSPLPAAETATTRLA